MRCLTSISFLFFMAFRSVLVEKAVKIHLDLNHIVIRYEEEDFWISLDEISNLIIDDPRCYVSLKLLSKLCEKGINVIFTDDSHMPVGSLVTLYNHSRAVKKIESQMEWSKETKNYLWTEIVRAKIKGQIHTLELIDKREKIPMMRKLLEELSVGDLNNREGIASRIYFKSLFGNQFKRFSEDIINYSLNYVYQVIRSKISQEIVSCGYLPSVGYVIRANIIFLT